jgi:caffeoyl-CoA O-methyltransferase
VLWSGRVIDSGDTGDDTEAIRAFNDLVAGDDRVDVVMLPVSDGLTLLRRRP